MKFELFNEDGTLKTTEQFAQQIEAEAWATRYEFQVYKGVDQRFDIKYQNAQEVDGWRNLGFWRSEELADRGHYTAELDAANFADQLMETFFMHTSPREMMLIRDRLNAYLVEWEDRKTGV